MPIDTANKRRSVSGYTLAPQLPVADATIDTNDREMVAWLYSGIAAAAPTPPVDDLPYQGDATVYDSAGATGSIAGGTVLAGDTAYDSAGATGSIGSSTTMPADVTYG